VRAMQPLGVNPLTALLLPGYAQQRNLGHPA
jgi:hypothetical protein